MDDIERDLPRQLLVFCDGTNNTLTGNVNDTNVLRLFEQVAAAHDEQQRLHYDPGVGSPDALPSTDLGESFARKWERISGLAAGRGVFENIGEAYAFVVREYRPGDEIWLFGFSRGAFTARSVSGLIHLFGIVKPEHAGLVDTLLRVYFSEFDAKSRATGRTRREIAEQVRRSFTTPQGREAWVHFIGVWDTVASVGLPPFSLRISSRATIREKRIRHVRQALALDEHRRPFQPRLYSDPNAGGPGDRQSLRQVWFRGAHCDVGGGYEESGLANDALEWMVDEARACGLRCAPARQWDATDTRRGRRAIERRVHDALYETALWAVGGMGMRDTAPCRRHERRRHRLEPVEPCVGRQRDAVCLRLEPHAAPAKAGVAPARDRRGDRGALGCAPRPGARRCHMDPSVRLARALLRRRDSPRCGASRSSARPARGTRVRIAHVFDSEGLSPARVSVWFDLLLVAAYAPFVARLLTWAFHRIAGLRRVRDPVPKAVVLGWAFSALIAGDLADGLFGWIAVSGAPGLVALPAAFLAAGAFLTKLVGLLGCALLVLLGLAPPPTATKAASG